MGRKTQTDGMRPPLCHAGQCAPSGGGEGLALKVDPLLLTPGGEGTRSRNFSKPGGSKLVGAAFEVRAQEFLQRQRLRFVARNVACRGGEIDLVMSDRDGALVFVEVRARAQRGYGGAAASIDWRKRRRIVHAARHYLATHSRRSPDQPVCRFDVIAFDAGRLVWLRDAFRADEV